VKRSHLALAVAGVVALGAAPVRADGLHRFAVIVGNDTGGGDTRPLLYARADARKVYDLLTRLGGVRADDAQLVLDGTAQDLLTALTETERRAALARGHGERTALVLYYSGHAKDGALRLGDTRLPLDSLKARIAASPVDVRIAILDSCRSGELTRTKGATKGARHAPAFQIQAEGPRDAKGLVILTSSASDEDSQESDLVGGSYFSHHLVSGLLGGADKSGDGRVTLFEAYAYAYDRTVADTAETAAGPQHPTFSYDLAGNGDLVLTDVAARREGIYLPREAPGGVYYLVDRQGFVAAEIVKDEGDRRIALAPGKYRVKRRLADRLRVGDVEVSSGQMITLDENRLRDAPFADDPVKGGMRVDVSRWSVDGELGFQSVFDAPSRESLFPSTGLVGLELQLRNFFRRDWVWGLDVAGGGANGVVTLQSTTAPFHFNEFTLASSLVVEWPHRALTPFVGGRLAYLLMTRRFDDDAFPAQYFSTISPGVVGGVTWHVTRDFGVVLRGRVHYLLYNVDENRSLGFWELATAVSYAL